VRPKNELEVIKTDLQSRFRSGVGILLYFIKHSTQDNANVVRDLAKYMDDPTLAAYKEMLRVIRFVLNTQLLWNPRMLKKTGIFRLIVKFIGL
jgi:hypothetical protein